MKTKQDYEQRLNESFSIELEQARLDLALIEVSSVSADTVESGQKEPFSAVFRSDNQDILEQGTYTLTHSEVGDLLLFLVPIGPDQAGMCYEAVFT
ncbi:DUF6916 family protein [Arenicella xantha]|nr:hypothetical protein [Arenicella xantha]